MNNFISYLVIADKELIVEYLNGMILPKDVFEFKKHLFNYSKFNSKYKLLIDCRNITALNNKSEIEKAFLIPEFKKLIFNHKKIAILISTPNQILEVSLFEELMHKLPLHIGIFNSLNSALKHLEFNTSENVDISKQLENLANNPDNVFYPKENY